jgi:hypothetical protein
MMGMENQNKIQNKTIVERQDQRLGNLPRASPNLGEVAPTEVSGLKICVIKGCSQLATKIWYWYYGAEFHLCEKHFKEWERERDRKIGDNWEPVKELTPYEI